MSVLSEECVLALQTATAAACVEALNAAPPSELWSQVLAVVNPVIRAQARKHMERLSCISRLPDELLVAIFARLAFWDRVRATTVCQRWRTVSLGAVSALWSDIPSLSNVDTYEPLLARARGFPVAVTYKPEELEDLEVFCFTLSHNLRLLKHLRLILPAPYDDDESIDAAQHLGAVLYGNAPILESLVIYDPDEICGRVHSSLPLLTSPMLRTIELNGFDLSYLKACGDSSAVKTLSVSTPDTYNDITPHDWFHLSRMTALESLSLNLADVFTAEITSHSPRLPQSLQHLHLQVFPVVFDALLTVEDLSRFRTVHITFLHRRADIRRLAGALPFLADSAVSAAVHFGGTHFSLLAADSSGCRRVFRHIKLNDDWHTLFPNVTTLWLDAHPARTEPPNATATFPALEELTLDATALPAAWPALSAPRLRVVRVISETTEHSPLDAGNVAGYLRRTIGSRAPLESLVFDGVRLDPEPDVNLAALAQTVQTVQSREVPRESYRVWANLWDKRSDS